MQQETDLMPVGWHAVRVKKKRDVKVHFFAEGVSESACRLAHRDHLSQPMPEAVRARCRHCVKKVSPD